MKKPLYTNNPDAWDRATRFYMSQAEYADPIERPLPSASKPIKAIALLLTVVLLVVAAVHLVARFA